MNEIERKRKGMGRGDCLSLMSGMRTMVNCGKTERISFETFLSGMNSYIARSSKNCCETRSGQNEIKLRTEEEKKIKILQWTIVVLLDIIK